MGAKRRKGSTKGKRKGEQLMLMMSRDHYYWRQLLPLWPQLDGALLLLPQLGQLPSQLRRLLPPPR